MLQFDARKSCPLELTLSVSTIAITSSSFTESPISFDHERRTAVVIESPRDSKGSTTTDDEPSGIGSENIVRN